MQVSLILVGLRKVDRTTRMLPFVAAVHTTFVRECACSHVRPSHVTSHAGLDWPTCHVAMAMRPLRFIFLGPLLLVLK